MRGNENVRNPSKILAPVHKTTRTKSHELLLRNVYKNILCTKIQCTKYTKYGRQKNCVQIFRLGTTFGKTAQSERNGFIRVLVK